MRLRQLYNIKNMEIYIMKKKIIKWLYNAIRMAYNVKIKIKVYK